MTKTKHYDVIVVGGGHAGCEAALAAARLGARTLLLTMCSETIGCLSCNPAIGGLAKGQLVKEIDALGGEMAKAADATLIQFRTLNTRKGPAVRSSRAQVDRHAYNRYMRAIVLAEKNLTVTEGMAETITTAGGRITGIETADTRYATERLIITTGTFLNGLIHIGLDHHPGGRIGERASTKLSASLKTLGLALGRLKTGTCPRLDSRSIDYSRLTVQHGDAVIVPFSFTSRSIERPQMPCHMTYTNPAVHEIIRANLNRSPLFTGVIKGTGVRYCPSIEDKIHRFGDRDRHHIFLEPESLETTDCYPNGISTSLPVDAQERMIYSIEGLEHARIVRPGYGIEYDFVDPTELRSSLETKKIAGLYLAGQINGTTGYEEAASLGLIAGINAARAVQKKEPFVPGRSQAYIGVLIDDLVTKGTTEPYRMFSSRVEYRLVLREDNADLRLTPAGYEIGLASEARYRAVTEKQKRIDAEIARLRKGRLDRILRRPAVSYNDAVIPKTGMTLTADEIRVVEAEIKYEGFIERQYAQIARFDKIERIRVPQDFDYAQVRGLSAEAGEKLARIRPANLGQAARISGVSPAAVSILMIYLEKSHRTRSVSRRKNDGPTL